MKVLLLSQDVAPSQKHKRGGIQPSAVQFSDELNRLLSAAVVNKVFCRKLLASPPTAITEGYCGYSFDLPEHESNILATIRCISLDDFARKLISRLTTSQNLTKRSDAVELEHCMVPVAQSRGDHAFRM